MLDFAKKVMAFTLGVAALTTDKAKQLVDEAVARGEISKEEAKKFLDEVVTAADKEKQNVQSWIREQVSKAVPDAGKADEERIAQLEARIAALEGAKPRSRRKARPKTGTAG